MSVLWKRCGFYKWTLDTGKHSVTVSINGQKRVINPHVVIDASGQQSVLANHFKIKQLEERRKNISIWTYYESANNSFSDEAVTIIAKATEANGWFWLIPVGNKTLSVGLVGEVDRIHSSGSNNERAILTTLLIKMSLFVTIWIRRTNSLRRLYSC